MQLEKVIWRKMMRCGGDLSVRLSLEGAGKVRCRRWRVGPVIAMAHVSLKAMAATAGAFGCLVLSARGLWRQK
jgi:hypothetical protein